MKKLKVGIIGATGMVGQRFVQILENHPWFEVKALAASSRSKGKRYIDAVKEKWCMTTEIPKKFENLILMDSSSDCEKICSMVDFIFCAVNIKKEDVINLENMYAKNECPVISNNSAHRWTLDVPLVIPEVNPEHINVIEIQKKRLNTKKGFIAVKPNCSLQCFLPVLYPIKKFGIKSIIVSTYQAISGAGKTFENFPEIVDNVIPYIDGEEQKTELEPLKILGKVGKNSILNAETPKIISNCIRVPISNGHLASVFAEFENDVSTDEIINIWENFNPINLPSSPKKLIKYFYENNRPQIKLDRNRDNGMGFNVGRLTKYDKNKIKFVCSSHNTIRGAAGGAILLAELLYKEKYLY
ncbi:MAG: aspartate-semialdehyde dehydrogenase [Clostridia bacterium]|nr:aspartate-semialdehyde dehydrogenase [Clostridia bacterium]